MAEKSNDEENNSPAQYSKLLKDLKALIPFVGDEAQDILGNELFGDEIGSFIQFATEGAGLLMERDLLGLAMHTASYVDIGRITDWIQRRGGWENVVRDNANVLALTVAVLAALVIGAIAYIKRRKNHQIYNALKK
ncbi:unnamed protein product [Calicophoron daubneyi]|uniref:Uncharacterized protein n=1 Tax=Calicophoron daubneyi TaxID=300641 RepID=A0AAV2SYS6_CALDB